MTTAQSTDTISTEKRALLALRKIRARLDAIEQAKTEPIAIIGMGCHLPGGVETPEQFWHFLQDGEDGVCEIPADRWDVDAYYEPEIENMVPGQTYCRHGGFLDEVDTFDARFFGISPREANMMDPQQRLLLEVTWEALERANLPPSQLMGTDSGVFIGIETQDYFHLSTDPLDQGNLYTATGGAMSVAAGRLAYYLGIHGPTMSIDTACSASLVAVHLACQSLRSGECGVALAGGVSLELIPHHMILGSQNRAMAADGRCKTFDAAADGTAIGEGCGMIVLKRLSDAVAAGDPIVGLVRGSAINHDGRSSGLAVPNGTAQRQVIHQALANAGVEPAQIGYVETHGTGTPLGDPVEVEALGAVFKERAEPLLIGSAKSQIGHLMSAAGIAGLIKSVLALGAGTVPAQQFFDTPNPVIPWHDLPVTVPTAATPFPEVNGRRLAGISAFGISGTNAHVIVEAYDPPQEASSTAEAVAPPLHLLPLSAKSEPALRALAEAYAEHLVTTDQPLMDICYSASAGRDAMAQRATVLGQTPAELIDGLRSVAAGQATTHRVDATPRTAFLFTGQEGQYVDMGRELYESAPVFRQAFDRCDEIASPYLTESLREYLYPAHSDSAHSAVNGSANGTGGTPRTLDLNQMTYSQLALFAVEYGLAQLWQAWGVEPDFVMGHSMGEYVAACVAGVFSVEDAIMLLAERSQLIHSLPENGAMVAIFASEAQVAAAIAPYENVVIALVNGPESVVISGAREGVHAAEAAVAAAGLRTRRLAATRGGHSPLLESICAPYEEIARRVTYHPPQIRLVSNVTGGFAGSEITTPAYWVRQMRQTVHFARGVETLLAQGCSLFLEIGPRPLLLKMCMYMVPDGIDLLPSLHPDEGNWQQMLASLATLYSRGAEIDWGAYYASLQQGGSKPQKVILPTYPFQRQRYWVDGAQKKQRATQALRPLVDKLTRLPLHGETVLESELSVDAYPYLADHRVYDAVVLPGAAYATMALHSAALALSAEGCEIQDLVLPQALIVPEEGQRTAQVVLKPVGNGGAFAEGTHEFQLVSFDGAQSTIEPLTHATGFVAPLTGQSPHQQDLESLQARCPDPVPVESLYAALASDDAQLGPSFQWVVDLRRGDRESLGRLALPESIGSTAGYALHPCLLDGCFQVAGATLDQAPDAVITMPFALERLRLYQPARGKEWWCHARQVDDQSAPGAPKWDITLFDQQGQCIAEVTGFEERAASAATVLDREPWHDWLYEVEWQPAPNANPDPQIEPQTWLLLADRTGCAERLAALLQERGEQVQLAYMGSEYRQVDGQRFELDPLSGEQYAQLLQDASTPNGVVHLWGLDFATGTREGAQADAPTAVQENATTALLLTQALLQTAADSAAPIDKLWLVTSNAQRVSANDDVAGTVHAPLWGFGRSLALEHPELHCACLDLGHTNNSEPVATDAEELLAALSASNAERAVAYRDGVRYIARLVRREPPPSLDKEPGLVRADGSYLITGGLGNLGLKIAHRFVSGFGTEGARHLVLMGRSGAATAAAQAGVRALEEAGATVRVVQGDVSNAEDVARAVKAAQSLAPLRGVVHGAMVIDDGAILSQTPERFGRVMTPKVAGAWHLHRATQDLALDFFINFSSDASLLGAAGQSNYAAANAFLDALAHHRQSAGLPALSINWGAWGDEDESSTFSEVQKAQIESLGASFIPTEIGLMLMERLTERGGVQVGVMPMEWEKWIQQFDTPVPPFFAGLHVEKAAVSDAAEQSFQQQLEAAPPEEQRPLLEAHVQQIASQVLGFGGSGNGDERIPMGQNFFDLGMDSLTSIELRNRLRKSLGCPLPATLAFSNPSVHALIDYLATESSVLSSVDAAESAEGPAASTEQMGRTQANDHSEYACLVKIRTGGEKPPLFCITGLVGLAFSFYPLANHLETDQPLYALQTPGAEDELVPYTTVEEIAAHHLHAMQTVQPEGPYHILGYSFGSRIAVELVRQLQAAGQAVAHLLIVDAAAEVEVADQDGAYGGDSVYVTILAEELARLHGTAVEIPPAVYAMPTLDEKLAYFQSQIETAAAAPVGGESERLQNFKQVLNIVKANAQADARYEVPRQGLSVPITLFKAQAVHPLNAMAAASADPTWGWDARSFQPVLSYTTPGDHFTMLMEPHIGTLAQRIRASLSHVQSVGVTLA